MKIGILTSGGDCQALNAAMRGVVKSITNAKKDVEIFHEGQELTLIKWDDTEGIYDTPYDIFSVG